MKEKLQKTQEKLKSLTTTAESGGGMVTVTINGHGDILDIKLDPSIVDPEDVGMLQDLILAALNAAMKKSREMSKEKMQGEMFGLSNMMNLPGMFGPK